MTVSNISAGSAAAQYTDNSVSQEYMNFIQEFYNVRSYKSRDEINAEDTALQQFKHDLITKGTAQFLADLDKEKIEAMVEEYRQKLLEEQKMNPDKPMDIEQMVSDFRKQLLEEMMEAQKVDEENKGEKSSLLMSKDILAQTRLAQTKDYTTGLPDIGFLTRIFNAMENTGMQNQKEEKG